MLAWRSWRDRRLTDHADLALTLAVGLGIAVIVMVAIHLWRPFIIGRYLVTLHPPLAMILALGVTALLDRARPVVVVLLSAAMTLAALVAIRENLARTVAQPSWYGTARAIATIRRSCPMTRIHVHAAGNSIAMAAPPFENRVVFPSPTGSSRRISAFRSSAATTWAATVPPCSGPNMRRASRLRSTA